MNHNFKGVAKKILYVLLILSVLSGCGRKEKSSTKELVQIIIDNFKAM